MLLYRRLGVAWSHLKRVLWQNYFHTTATIEPQVFVVSFFVLAALLGVRQAGGLEPLELVAFDWMTQWRSRAIFDKPPEETFDPRLTIMAIEENDIDYFEQWPISDELLARTLRKLLEYDPVAIGIDIYRDVPQHSGREALLKELQNPKIIAIENVGASEQVSVEPPPGVPPERIGFNDVPLDSDKVIRRALLFLTDDSGEVVFSFALRLALPYLARHDIFPKNSSSDLRIYLGAAAIDRLQSSSGGYQQVDAQGYQILLQYRTSKNVARTIALRDLLADRFDPDWVRDRIVLIGATAPSTKDVFFTPYSATSSDRVSVPGVEIHAHAVSQILTAACNDFYGCNLDSKLSATSLTLPAKEQIPPLFWFLPEWVELAWIVGWAIAGGWIVWRSRHRWRLVGAWSLAVSSIVGTSVVLFLWSGWVPIVAPLGTFLATSVTVLAYRLLYKTYYDDLTGLPNRALFVQRMRRFHQQAAVLLLDLARFKIVNAGAGHAAGDLLLVEASRRLRSALRPFQGKGRAGILARVSGDRFAIAWEMPSDRISDRNPVLDLARSLQTKLSQPYYLKGKEVFVGANVGIAYGDESDRRDLLLDAHTALFRAKSTGKRLPEVFQPVMETSVVHRFQIERDLRQTLMRHQCYPNRMELPEEENALAFLLYYQPLVCLKTGKTCGFEALLRWQHPERGLVSPGHVIPVAEETGTIVPIGEWVLRQACRQLVLWQEKLALDRPLMISVNLSGIQFEQPDLVERVQEIVKETGIPPACLKLEITESIAMDNIQATIDILWRLKSLGMKLSIDDFGTGYSSLAYLSRFPTDTLKVDRSFVCQMIASPQDKTIVQAIVDLARNLQMNVIAEGIETEEQLTELRLLQCRYGQGYFFSKPLPVELAEKFLMEDRQW